MYFACEKDVNLAGTEGRSVFLSNSYAKVLASVFQSVTVFRERDLKEAGKLK